MKYLRNLEPIHREALHMLAQTLATGDGLSLRDLHYRLAENQSFESWLRAMLFKDVWDFTQFVEVCDLTEPARKEKSTVFEAMKDRLISVWKRKDEVYSQKHLELDLIQLKKAYLSILLEVEGYKFAERMFKDDPEAPTLWIHAGQTAIGQRDYFLSYGDLMHFFTNMVFADRENEIYNATLDLYFTVSFDYANAGEVDEDELRNLIATSRASMVEVGREILSYMTHLDRKLN